MKSSVPDTKKLLENLRRNQIMMTEHYNRFINACAGDPLREDVIGLLQDEHTIDGILITQLQEHGLLHNDMASKESMEAVKREARVRKNSTKTC